MISFFPRPLFVLLALAACRGEDPTSPSPPPFVEVACTPDQPAPYPSGLPYVGIHANAANDDVVPCETADNYRQAWHALKGRGVVQPATMSPDGETLYVTTTTAETDGCTVSALAVADGAEEWCLALPTDVAASAVEVDDNGDLFLSAGGQLLSFDASGAERWSTPLWPADATPADEDLSAYTGYGVHFTADGYVATVTAAGLVAVADRSDGTLVATLDLPTAFGLVPPAPTLLSGFDLISLMPPDVVDDIESIFGDNSSEALGSFFGSGTNFSDNTIAISPRGDFYIIGGGPDEDHGAMVKVEVSTGPTLSPGWMTVTRPGSAATPSVTPDGRWVAASDGTATRDLMDPESGDATVFAVDVDACDANTDGDPDRLICAVAWEHALQRGPMPGAPALLPDGRVWFYELGFSLDSDPTARDLVRVGPDGAEVEAVLPDELEWNSVLTITDNHMIGTASVIVPSDELMAGITLPSETLDELVVVSREDASVVFRAPITDDSAATVSLGPDGSLYVGLLGLTTVMAVDERPTLGLVRFRPIE